MTEPATPPKPIRARLIAGLLAAGALIAAGGANTIALASANPMVLEALAPWSGVAASKAVEFEVQTALSAPNLVELRENALRALRREPIDFRAARSIALASLGSGDKERAEKIFRTVARHTLREPITHIWLISDAFENRRYGEFLREAEVVMRDQPGSSSQVFLMLTKLVDQRQVVPQIVEKVAAKPEWRSGFFDTFGEKSQNSAAAFDFYRRVKASGAPATASEQRVWLLHEIGRSDPAEVIRMWKVLQTQPLSAAERLLRNPGFEGTTAPQPFDWTFFLPEGSFAEVTGSPAGQGKSLYVEMTGRQPMTVARQVLDLPPGRYTVSYRAFLLTDPARKELRVALDCAQGRTFAPRIENAVVAARETWSRHKFDVTIPAGCAAQQLRIGMEPGGLSTSVQAYFDDFAIARVEG